MMVERRRSLMLAVAGLALLLGSSACTRAEAPATGPVVEPIADAETLERQMWTAMASANWAAVENRIAPGFQSVHQDGGRNRAGEIELIKSLRLGPYTLADFQSTRSGSSLVVTYTVSVEETIDGKPASSAPAPRLSVWQHNGQDWQWVAHANLNAISK